jgi:putative DNA primase/helicase
MSETKQLGAAIYRLCNGTAKGRLNRDSSPKEIAHWRLSILSCGETSLEAHQIGAGVDHKAGQNVRFCDIPVIGGFGVFDDLHQRTDGAAFSEDLRRAASIYYGTAGPQFIEQLTKHRSTMGLQNRLNEIVASYGQKLSPQEGRVLRSFSAIALAGELAIEWRILPWCKGSAAKAALDIFEHWRQAQPESATSREHAQILERILDFISEHGSSRFSDHEGEIRVVNRADRKKSALESCLKTRAAVLCTNRTHKITLALEAGSRAMPERTFTHTNPKNSTHGALKRRFRPALRIQYLQCIRT